MTVISKVVFERFQALGCDTEAEATDPTKVMVQRYVNVYYFDGSRQVGATPDHVQLNPKALTEFTDIASLQTIVDADWPSNYPKPA